jgi:hypothetical protein
MLMLFFKSGRAHQILKLWSANKEENVNYKILILYLRLNVN